MAGEMVALRDNPQMLARAVKKFDYYLQRSLVMFPMIIYRQTEVARRFHVLEYGYKVLVHDMKRSPLRAMDECQDALECDLKGIAWEPNPRKSFWGTKGKGQKGLV